MHTWSFPRYLWSMMLSLRTNSTIRMRNSSPSHSIFRILLRLLICFAWRRRIYSILTRHNAALILKRNETRNMCRNFIFLLLPTLLRNEGTLSIWIEYAIDILLIKMRMRAAKHNSFTSKQLINVKRWVSFHFFVDEILCLFMQIRWYYFINRIYCHFVCMAFHLKDVAKSAHTSSVLPFCCLSCILLTKFVFIYLSVTPSKAMFVFHKNFWKYIYTKCE